MIITPKQGILLIKKHKKTQVKEDIVMEEMDEDKRLVTGEVISSNNKGYALGATVIFGKYALYPLTIQGEDFFLLDEDDVLGTCDYKE